MFWLMNRRELINGPRVPHVGKNQWIYWKLVCIRLGISNCPNKGRKYLRQEPAMVLVPSTISMNVPVELNFLYELRIHLSSLWVGYVEKTRLYATLAMRY